MNMKKTAAVILATLMMATAIPAAIGAEEATTVEDTAVTAENAVAETTDANVTEEAAVTEESATTETAETNTTEETATAETTATVPDEAQLLTISDTQKLDAAYTLALSAINAEDYETAKEYINICFAYCDAQSNPIIFSDLLLKRACIDVIEQKNDMALLNLDAALRVNPELADAYLVRTQVYSTLGDADRAISSLEKYIELTQDTSMYETVAQLQEAKGDMQAAQAAYEKYVEGAGGEIEEAEFQAGLYKMENGKFEEAIKAFEAYQDNETYSAGASYNIGICKMNLMDYAGAVEAFNNCEAKGGKFEGLYYNRGVCSLLIGDWTSAANDFTKSIESEPYAEDARYNLGICQMQSEDYEGAVATLTAYIDGEKTEGGEAATEERVVNDGAYYYRAACLAAIGKLEEAIADYTVCIEHEFDLGQSYYQRAQIYAALGDTANQNADLAESLKHAN